MTPVGSFSSYRQERCPELRVEQSQSFDPGELAFDQARADIRPIARIGHDNLSCQGVRGIACRLDGLSSAGDNKRVAACAGRDQHSVLQRDLAVMNMPSFSRREIAFE